MEIIFFPELEQYFNLQCYGTYVMQGKLNELCNIYTSINRNDDFGEVPQIT